MKKTLLTFVLLASTSSFANEVVCTASVDQKTAEMQMSRTIENIEVLTAQISDYNYSLLLDTLNGDIIEATIFNLKSKSASVANGNANQLFELRSINGDTRTVAKIECQSKK